MAVLFIVFGGYYVNSATVPRALRWVPSASLIQHGFQVSCLTLLDNGLEAKEKTKNHLWQR